jgi:hypothetical protein
MQDKEVVSSAEVAADPAQSTGHQPFSLQDLLEQYWFVARCWANHEMSVRENMTFETAMQTLSRVEMWSLTMKGGMRLSKMANKLRWDIVNRCEDNPELEAAMAADEQPV